MSKVVGKWFVHKVNMKNSNTSYYIYQVMDIYMKSSFSNKRICYVDKYEYNIINGTIGEKLSYMIISYSMLMMAFKPHDSIKKYTIIKKGMLL